MLKLSVMYKPLLLSALLFPLFALAQQPDESLKPVAESFNSNFALQSAVIKLVTSQYYSIKKPAATRLHTENENAALYSIAPLLQAKPRTATTKAKDSRTFTIVSSGIKLLGKTEDEEIPVPNSSKVKGWVRNYYYTMSLTLVVINELGEKEREIILADDKTEYKAILHKNFLKDNPSKNGGINTPALPFLSVTELAKAAEAGGAIQKRIERNHILAMLPLLKSVIETAYGGGKLPAESFSLLGLDSKGKTAYPELADHVSKLKMALFDINDEKKRSGAFEKLQDLYYQNEVDLKQQEIYPINYKKLLLYNGAIASLFAGNTARAENLYNQFKEFTDSYEQGANTSLKKQFEKYYSLLNTWHTLAQATNLPVALNTELSVPAADNNTAGSSGNTTPPATETPVDANDPNIYFKTGYVVLTNQQRVEGKLLLLFVQTQKSELPDNAIGNTVIVADKIDSAKQTSYNVSNVSYVVVGNKRYEPASIRVSGLTSILNKASGKFSDWEFLEKAYQKDNYTVYYKPNYGHNASFSIFRTGGDKAYSFADITRKAKVTAKFFEPCPSASSQLPAGSFSNNLDGASKLADWLSINCK